MISVLLLLLLFLRIGNNCYHCATEYSDGADSLHTEKERVNESMWIQLTPHSTTPAADIRHGEGN